MSRAGAAGMAALDRYQEHGERDDLQTAIRSLAEALAEVPEHPDALTWHWWLALLFSERGSLDDSVADLDQAVKLTEMLVAWSGAADAVHDPATAALAERLWDRARATDFAGVDALVDRLGRLEEEAARPTARHIVRSYRGLALMEAFERSGRAADRDLAITLLDEALTAFTGEPPDDPVWEWTEEGGPAYVAVVLCHARQTRADGIRDLDRSIEVARDGIARHGGDPGVRAALTELLGGAHDLRWQMRSAAGDEAAGDDLDAAIDAWTAAGDDPHTRLMRSSLMATRADLRDDADEAGRAAALLAEAAAEADDRELSAELWHGAAVSSRVAWEITGDLDALVTAAGHAERAIAGADDDDLLLDCHQERVFAEHFLKDNGRVRPGRGRRATLLAEVTDDAVRALDRAIRADPDRRVEFALLIGFLSFSATEAEGGELDVARTRGLFGMAAAAPGLPSAFADTGLGTLELVDSVRHPGPHADHGIRLFTAARAAGADAELRERIDGLLTIAAQVRGSRTGSRRDIDVVQQLERRSPQWRPPASGRRLRGESAGVGDPLMSLAYEVTELVRGGQLHAAKKAVDDAAELLDQRDGTMARPIVAYLRTLASVIDPFSGPVHAPEPDDPDPGVLGTGYLTGIVTDIAAFVQSLARGARPGAVAAVEHLERLVDRLPPGNQGLRRDAHGTAGALRLILAESAPAGGGPDADRAAAHLRRAMEMSAGPSTAGWALLAMSCARALRIASTPDLPGSRAIGMSALRAHAWQVFAQAGTDHAIAVAAAAATDAAMLVRWCLADRAAGPAVPAELIAALEGSRALVLRASGASRRVPDLLRDRRRDDLAAEWEATAGQGRDLLTGMALLGERPGGVEVPDALRAEVIAALRGHEVTGLATVTPAEIRSRLRDLGRDALVYLVPGAAVVVPAAGEPYLVDLPELTEAPGPRRAGGGPHHRDLGPVDGGPDAGRDDLDALCAWAWRAAMGPLIPALPGRRVVLVPTGELALTPWHAAYRTDGDRRHYAVQDLVVSYSPSAGLLPGPAQPVPDGATLIVGDPTGDLPAAGDEARAIREAFYPGAAVAGRPDEVLAWLSARPAGAAVLHFACHADLDPARPADAHLVLDGGRLSVRRLLEQAGSRALDVDQVFLAACTTGAAAAHHDEALSLATSFLVAGARTVVGSLWPVPDGDTALLMFLVHHHLRREGCDPATALHRAQLWMLDPGRALPPGTPARLLHRHRPGVVPELSAWAGFIHVGR